MDKMKSREKAIAWWDTLSDSDKAGATRMVISEKRSYKSLTGREIEIIYNWTLEN